MDSRSPESYEREIRSLSKALHDECANSYRLAQENAQMREELDALALGEHVAAHPTPASGLKVETLSDLAAPRTAVFRKPDGSPLIELTLTHTFSKLTGLRRRRDG